MIIGILYSMFVIADFTNEEKRLFEKFRKHDFEFTRCNVQGCAPFFILRGHRLYSDMAEAENIIKQFGLAIFKDDIVPGELGRYKFKPRVLPVKMIIKSVCEVYSDCPELSKNITVSVFDPYAKFCDEVTELSCCVRFLKVVTKRTDVYEKIQQKIYSMNGAAIYVGNNQASADGSDIAIALSDDELTEREIKYAFVYYKSSFDRNIFQAQKYILPISGYEKEAEKVDYFSFFSALYETCGYKILKIPSFSDVKSFFLKVNT